MISRRRSRLRSLRGDDIMNEIMGAGDWPTFNPITMKDCMNAAHRLGCRTHGHTTVCS